MFDYDKAARTTRRRLDTRLRLCACALLAVLSAGAAADHEPETGTEAEFFSDLPEIASVTRLPQVRSETPAAVTVIDRDVIKASGIRQIADLFRLVPGFQVGYETGNKAKVTYHGLSDGYPRNMQVLVDGRSVYSPFFGGVFWSELPLALEDIERIEVIRGPNAAVYGSNAVLATINIVTRHPSQDPGTLVNSALGNHQIRDGFARYGATGDSVDTRVSVGYRADDGVDTHIDQQRVPFVNLRTEYRASTRDTVDAQLGVSHAVQGEGFLGDVDEVPRTSSSLSHFEQLRWRRDLGLGEEIGVHFYHNYRRLDDNYLTEPLNLGPMGIVRVPVSMDATEERYDLEFQHTLRPVTDWRFVWGAGARIDRVRSTTWFSRPDFLDNRLFRLFGNAEWRITPKAVVNAGGMVEKTDITDTSVSPRLALNYHVTPQHTLRAAVSRAHRIPELLEKEGNQQFFYNGVLLVQEIVGSAQLEPEVIDSCEAGYFGQAPAQHLNWDIRLYKDRIRDLVNTYRIPSADLFDGSAFKLRNDGAVTIAGIDLHVEYQPVPGTRLILGHAQMGVAASDTIDGGRDQQRREESVPQYSSSLLIMHRLSEHWHASAAGYWVGQMRWLGDGDLVDPYSRVDLRLAQTFHVGTGHGEAAVVVQNAADNHYADFNWASIADRRVFLTLSLDTH